MSFGLSSTGFVRKRLEDIKAELENAFVEKFGNVRTDPESLNGQLIGIFADAIAKEDEQLENIYYAMYPNSAEGVALDNAVGFNGIVRLPATRTTVRAAMYATSAPVTVPANTSALSSDNGERFLLITETVLDNWHSVDAFFGVGEDEFPAAGTYVVQINAVNYSASTTGSRNQNNLLTLIADGINAADIGIFAEVVQIDGVVYNLRLTAIDYTTDFAASPGTGTTLEKFATSGLFEAEFAGNIACIQHTLNIIETPVSGLDSIDNFLQGSVGRLRETDGELRARRVDSIQIVGAATLDSIRARLLQYVPDISQCFVFENPTDAVDVAGRPPHSLHVVVAGSNTESFYQAVAAQIWAVKAAGIQTFADSVTGIVRQVIDSQGTSHDVSFDIPINKYFWSRITCTLNPEETLPADWQVQVQNAVINYGLTLNIGQDLIYQKFYTPIYSVPGIASVLFDIAITAEPGDLPTYVTENIPIGATAIAVFDSSRITVSAV